MRQEHNSWDELSCWLCDYAWLPIVFAVVLLAGWYVRDFWLPPAGLPGNETPNPPIPTNAPPTLLPILTSTRVPIIPTELPTIGQTPTPSSALPQYIVVVVPLNWQGDRASFEADAEQQISLFYVESGFNRYFQLQIKLLDDNMQTDLSSDTLIYDMVEFAAEREPADRYIGLTDRDISLDGDSNIAGWTMGPNSLGVVGEVDGENIVAHELGHTYGLCDEYNYLIWTEQNEEFQNGCPNPFPVECEQLQVNTPYCSGAPTSDGRNSIMGPAGLEGEYGFNTPSLEHLLKVFADMALLN